tara:strand:+ start:304 stop:747 length:444 start_codon:yes stop_codon:yes gene_type:complete
MSSNCYIIILNINVFLSVEKKSNTVDTLLFIIKTRYKRLHHYKRKDTKLKNSFLVVLNARHRRKIMADETNYNLSDEAIAHVAKLIQIAILSGTDIVDNLRTMRLVESSDGSLVLSDSYREASDGNIEKMLLDIENHKDSATITFES